LHDLAADRAAVTPGARVGGRNGQAGARGRGVVGAVVRYNGRGDGGGTPTSGRGPGDEDEMAKLSVQIVTAEREVLAEDGVDMVIAPGSEGEMGILPRHVSLLTTLRPGVLRLKRGADEQVMAVSGGFMQVASDRVLVLADTAERDDEIDEQRAEAGRRRALEALEAARRGAGPQVEAARIALRRSLARLQVVQRRRRRTMP